MDITAYRRAEALARQSMPTWRIAQRHHSKIFTEEGFPQRLESTADLVALLDTMQEDRFEPYMQELEGLDESDLALFVDALADHARFIAATFHQRSVRLPLDTMIAQFALYKKLCGFNPGFTSVLEIGSGCGYLSFFMKRRLGQGRYCQVEVTESFYFLQYLVNAWCFPGRVSEWAMSDHAAPNYGVEVPKGPTVTLPSSPLVHHVPWWRIGDLEQQRFDIITANAVLLELNEKTLVHYLDLFAKCLKPNGALIIQCFGGIDADPRLAFQTLHRLRFAPLALVNRGKALSKEFVVANACYVREGNPNFEKMYAQQPGVTVFSMSDPTTQRMYLPPADGTRRLYTADEIAELVKSKF